MPPRRFERIALPQLLVAGCAVVFGVCVLFEHAKHSLPVQYRHRRRNRRPSIHPIPVLCLKRLTRRLRLQRQAPFQVRLDRQ